jgi:hypothetical protein
MSTPYRLKNGVSNIASGKTMSNYPAPDPTLTYGYFNDFFQYAATDWVLTTAEAGAGNATEAIAADETGGVLTITNAGGNGDHDNFQLSGDGGTNDSESFLFATGKKAWMKARFKSNDVDKIHSFIGLHITNTDPVNAAPTDGVYFELTAGVLSCVVRKDSTSSSETLTPPTTLADDTFVSVGYYWNGVDTLHVFVDDIELQTIGSTNLPDDEYLAVSFGVENEEAATNTLEIDYIGAWMER